MTVHKVSICKCGHELDDHEGGRGGCKKCHSSPSPLGTEPCAKFRKRGHAGLREGAAPVLPKIDEAKVDPILVAMRALVTAGNAISASIRALEGFAQSRPGASPPRKQPPLAAHFSTGLVSAKVPHAREGSELLGKGERAILIAIAQRPAGATHAAIAVLTGYKKTSRRTYLGELKACGYVEQLGSTYRATGPGLDALGAFERLPTGRALVNHWLGELPGGERKVFESICRVEPVGRLLTELLDHTLYKKTSLRTYLGKLMARELIVRKSGRYHVSPELLSEEVA